MRCVIVAFNGGARNFPTGAASSDDGAKIWFSGYYKCQKSPKSRFSPSDGGPACSDEGAIAPLPSPGATPGSVNGI